MEPIADRTDAGLVAELNDLVQLDRDAVHAYSVAITFIRDDFLRERLADFRRDHERHIEALSRLIESRGGFPATLPHLPTGLLKLGLQTAGVAGGDRGILLALQANELQAEEKYARHARRPHPGDVAAVLRQNAEDERRHAAWVAETLESLGAGRGTMLGTTARTMATLHGATADAIEGVQRTIMAGLERARRGG